MIIREEKKRHSPNSDRSEQWILRGGPVRQADSDGEALSRTGQDDCIFPVPQTLSLLQRVR